MSPKPAILELNFEKSWRGGERHTLYNILGFRDAGIDVQLLYRKGTPLHQVALAGVKTLPKPFLENSPARFPTCTPTFLEFSSGS